MHCHGRAIHHDQPLRLRLLHGRTDRKCVRLRHLHRRPAHEGHRRQRQPTHQLHVRLRLEIQAPAHQPAEPHRALVGPPRLEAHGLGVRQSETAGLEESIPQQLRRCAGRGWDLRCCGAEAEQAVECAGESATERGHDTGGFCKLTGGQGGVEYGRLHCLEIAVSFISSLSPSSQFSTLFFRNLNGPYIGFSVHKVGGNGPDRMTIQRRRRPRRLRLPTHPPQPGIQIPRITFSNAGNHQRRCGAVAPGSSGPTMHREGRKERGEEKKEIVQTSTQDERQDRMKVFRYSCK